jgi:hypothetical protein
MSDHVTLAESDAAPLPKDRSGGLFLGLLVVTLLSTAAALVGLALEPRRFFFSYLTAFVFTLTIALGALFWVLIHHTADAGWSVVIRRRFENFARAVPLWAVLFVPLLVGLPYLYEWVDPVHLREELEHTAPGTPAHAHAAAELRLLELKSPYLNVPFFVIRAVVYFVVWATFAVLMVRWSARQDETGDLALSRKMRWWSPLGLLLLGLTVTFAVFDWVMSLTFSWYSTIFGVTYWASGILAAMAAQTLVTLAARANGFLDKSVTAEHLHDMGKLMFAFTCFWAYVNFSQYFLYWYANIAEEVQFYTARRVGSWYGLTVALCYGHFIIPFLFLLPRTIKRIPFLLGTAAVWILTFHYLNLYWQIMPVCTPSGVQPHWLDAACLLALGGLLGLAVLDGMRRFALVPVRDPRLAESLLFHQEV